MYRSRRLTTVTREDIVHKFVAKDQQAIRWSILVLYKRQTETEQATEHTTNRNYRGFQPADAKWLSRMAEWYLRGPRDVEGKPTRTLTEKQMAIVLKPHWVGNAMARRQEPRLAKYARQLVKIIEANAARKVQP